MPKKHKFVLLISTMHEGLESNIETDKPAIIHIYNETKAEVDTLDQLCLIMNSNRKTKKCPLCIFYGIINMTRINLNKKENIVDPSLCLSNHGCCIDGISLGWNIRQDIATILKYWRCRPILRKQNTCFYCPSKKRRVTCRL